MAEHIARQNLPKGDRPLWKKPATVIAGPRRGAVEIGRPGAKPGGRSGKPQRRAHAAPSGEPAPKKEYKAGWAKPKPKVRVAPKAPGSKRGRGQPAGPRGPKPSASPPQTTGARPQGPP